MDSTAIVAAVRAQLARESALPPVPHLPPAPGVCPVCRGHGEIDSACEEAWQTFPCGACAGSGRVRGANR
jgi:hypothetical protein